MIDLDRVLSALSEKFAKAPIKSMQIELQVGVTEAEPANDGLKFAILDMSANGGYARESIQKLTLNLAPPEHTTGPSDEMPRTRGQVGMVSHAEARGDAADNNSANGDRGDT